MNKFIIDEQKTFEINEDLNCEIIDILDGNYKIVIVDDFYKNPDLVRELALAIPPSFNERTKTRLPGGRITAYYVLDHFWIPYYNLIKEVYPILTKYLPPDAIEESFRDATFMVNVMCDEWIEPRPPHIDHPSPTALASAIYLNTPEECAGGTAFYTFDDFPSGVEMGLDYGDKDTDVYVSGNIGKWKLQYLAEMKYNRMILYPSSLYHGAYIKPGMFCNGIYRLNQQFFI